LWDYPKFSCPMKRGSHYFYYHNSGLQNQRYILLTYFTSPGLGNSNDANGNDDNIYWTIYKAHVIHLSAPQTPY